MALEYEHKLKPQKLANECLVSRWSDSKLALTFLCTVKASYNVSWDCAEQGLISKFTHDIYLGWVQLSKIKIPAESVTFFQK